jgi:ABC-type nitrate/sulfonate/bicarbonate transport system, permease component
VPEVAEVPGASTGAQKTASLVGFVGLLVLWEVLIEVLDVPTYVLPKPSSIGQELIGSGGLLLRHTWVTLTEIGLGFVFGTVIGVGSAILVTQVKLLRAVLVPWLVALQALPKVTLAPLLVVWMGFGLSSKVTLAAIFCFFPTFVNMLSGMERVDRTLLELSGVCRGNRWRTFTQIRLPSSLPQLFDGMRIAMPLAVVGAIVAEFSGAEAGLGWLLNVAASSLRTDLAFAAIVMSTLIAILLYSSIDLIRRLVAPWSQ